MHWNPLSGAKFEEVFGPAAKPAYRSRVRARRTAKRAKTKPKIELLEERQTPAAVASVVATSLASTPGTQTTIGEVVRYRVVTEVPFDNTNYDPSNLYVSATLAPGLSYLGDGTTKV